MKKLLLGSSILAAVAIASAAQADTPKITVGGFTDWQAGHVSEDFDTNRRSTNFFNDTEINFNVDGKAENGLGYGAVIVLEADVTNDSDTQGTNAAETYIYLDGGWGRVELGSTAAASGKMKVDASTIARATGGTDGDWYRFAAAPTSGDLFLISPDLTQAFGFDAGGTGNEAQENTNKVSYYSPSWNGFQLGLSYAPNDRDRGQTIDRTDNGTGTNGTNAAENIVYAGLSYEGEFQGLGFNVAATAEHGDAELNTFEDLFAWNVGLQTSYMGIALAGSYGDWGDSLTLKTGNFKDSSYYTLGAAYEFGAYGVSVNYLNSESGDSSTATNDFTNLVIGADYQLAPGLTPYAEVNFFEFDGAGTGVANDNDGTVILVGTQLNF